MAKLRSCTIISGAAIFKTALLVILMVFSVGTIAGESFPEKAIRYSEAASLRPIRFSRKNELRFWRLGWSVSGRVVTEEYLSFYGNYDKRQDRFLSFEKKHVLAPKDFVSDLEKLSSLDGAQITCDSGINDWPIYMVEGSWHGKHFTFLANIDLCTSEHLKILQKYSGYQEMLERMNKE